MPPEAGAHLLSAFRQLNRLRHDGAPIRPRDMADLDMPLNRDEIEVLLRMDAAYRVDSNQAE